LDNWIYWTRLGTASNYSATTNLHTLQITTAPAKPFSACCVLISRSLAVASNSGDSPVSCAHVVPSTDSRSELPARYSSSLYSPGKDRTENVSFIIACFLVAGETTCPQSCSLATAVVLPPVYTAVTWQWVYMTQYFNFCCNKARNESTESVNFPASLSFFLIQFSQDTLFFTVETVLTADVEHQNVSFLHTLRSKSAMSLI
jgi:hypothetical protein